MLHISIFGGHVMEIRYHTKKGSIYIQRIEEGGELWLKENRYGEIRSLAGGVHISVRSLHKLVTERPSLLDSTYCFDMGVEKDLFEDAKKERFTNGTEKEETIIFFLTKKGNDQYGIGCSSLIDKIER